MLLSQIRSRVMPVCSHTVVRVLRGGQGKAEVGHGALSAAYHVTPAEWPLLVAQH